MSNHSPGPWKSAQDFTHPGWPQCPFLAVHDSEEHLVATVLLDTGEVCGVMEYSREDSAKANARLIAAAPELLEALEDILDELESLGMGESISTPQKAYEAVLKTRHAQPPPRTE